MVRSRGSRLLSEDCVNHSWLHRHDDQPTPGRSRVRGRIFRWSLEPAWKSWRLCPSRLSSDPLTMTVREGATALGNSRALAYELVARGEIPAIRLGHRIVVPTQRLKDLVLGRGCASGVLEDTTESSKIGERPPFATAPERRLCHTLEIKLRDFWIFLTDERSCGGNCDPRRAVIARNQDNEALGSSTTGDDGRSTPCAPAS